jgi:hypothetical protein
MIQNFEIKKLLEKLNHNYLIKVNVEKETESE